jgi:hypothetical protein
MFPEILTRSWVTPECFFPDSLRDADGQDISMDNKNGSQSGSRFYYQEFLKRALLQCGRPPPPPPEEEAEVCDADEEDADEAREDAPPPE